MRAFVTGGAGFLGGALVRLLRDRGDEVVALVRGSAQAEQLRAAGCEPVEGDLASVDRLREAMDGCDAAFHVAGIYRVGVSRRERAQMHAANLVGTANTIDAAVAAGVERIVYVSTINAFGNTGYRVVDETYRRPQPPRYLSYYDETKHRAHMLAEERIGQGAPLVIVQPGQIYGRGDHSAVGDTMRRAAAGRLPALSLGEAGLNLVHVDDVAAGILLAHDRGEPGHAYVLGGEITTLQELVYRCAAIGARRPPRLRTPGWLLRGASVLSPRLRELVSAGAGVTYWATDARARRELGYAPRDLETGLSELFGNAGSPARHAGHARQAVRGHR